MLKNLLIKFAPTLAFALTGGNPFVKVATKAVIGALGLKADASDADIAEALGEATPEQMQKLRDAEYTFKTRMKELEIDVFKLEVADRNSARQLAAANGGLIQGLIAFLVIGGWAAFLALMFIKPISADNQIVLVAYGTLSTAVGTVLGFYFGTTKSSADKNAIIANQRR